MRGVAWRGVACVRLQVACCMWCVARGVLCGVRCLRLCFCVAYKVLSSWFERAHIILLLIDEPATHVIRRAGILIITRLLEEETCLHRMSNTLSLIHI